MSVHTPIVIKQAIVSEGISVLGLWWQAYQSCLLTFITSILQVRMRLKFWQERNVKFQSAWEPDVHGFKERPAFWSKADLLPVLLDWPRGRFHDGNTRDLAWYPHTLLTAGFLVITHFQTIMLTMGCHPERFRWYDGSSLWGALHGLFSVNNSGNLEPIQNSHCLLGDGTVTRAYCACFYDSIVWPFSSFLNKWTDGMIEKDKRMNG